MPYQEPRSPGPWAATASQYSWAWVWNLQVPLLMCQRKKMLSSFSWGSPSSESSHLMCCWSSLYLSDGISQGREKTDGQERPGRFLQEMNILSLSSKQMLRKGDCNVSQNSGWSKTQMTYQTGVPAGRRETQSPGLAEEVAYQKMRWGYLRSVSCLRRRHGGESRFS